MNARETLENIAIGVFAVMLCIGAAVVIARMVG